MIYAFGHISGTRINPAVSVALWATKRMSANGLAASGKISAAGAFVVPLILSWAIACISLVALELGTLTIDLQGEIQKVPVWHCQSIPAALAYLHFGSILVAGIVGILATFLQDLMARMFWNHGSNHVDPPATAMALGTLILNVVHKLI